MLGRATLTALRARHTAFRIALDILFPTQPPPSPTLKQTPVPVRSVFTDELIVGVPEWVEAAKRASEAKHAASKRRRELLAGVMLAVFLALCTAVILVAILFEKPSAPPSAPLNPTAVNPDAAR